MGSANFKKISRDESIERKTIQRLFDMMEEFGIVNTWAITGHLFYEEYEECDICPVLELKGKDNHFGQIRQTRDPMSMGLAS